MKRTAAIASLLALLAVALGARTTADEKKTAPAGKKMSAAHEAKHVALAPSDIQWTDAPPVLPAGAKFALLEGDPAKAGPVTMRLKMPDGYKIQPHWHPGIEHVTVLSGTANIGVGDKFDESKGSALPAGAFAYMSPRMHHFFWTKGATEIQIHTMGPWALHYVSPADDPSKAKSAK